MATLSGIPALTMFRAAVLCQFMEHNPVKIDPCGSLPTLFGITHPLSV